nr:uncharacterized protein LOC124813922 [Hydra vulgaris]
MTLPVMQPLLYDDIASNAAIYVMDSISKPLFYLIAFSFENSIFPDKLNPTKIHPVFKNRDCSSVCNYRPISLVPRYCSTEHAIIELPNKISMSFDKGEQVLGVFIDLSKAFDSVDHGILLSKLMHYGIKGLTYK